MPRIEQYRAVCLPPGQSLAVDPEPGVMRVESDLETKVQDRVDYLCPCGCGARIYLHIDQKRGSHPSWQLNIDADGLPTLTPSINDTGCKSHYFIRGGKVIWC